MDELAYALTMDPVGLRLVNHAEKDILWSSRSLRERCRTGAERFGWAPAHRRRSMRAGTSWSARCWCAAGPKTWAPAPIPS